MLKRLKICVYALQSMRACALSVTLFLAAVSGLACIGDAGRVQRVALVNSTLSPVLVYQDSGDLGKITRGPDSPLPPGQTRETGWFVPPGTTKTLTVKAFDDRGVLIFCKTFSFLYEDAARTVLRVEIVKGEVSCH